MGHIVCPYAQRDMRTINIAIRKRFSEQCKAQAGVFAIALCAGTTLSACSQMVDPAPPAKAPENNITPYYMNLQTKGTQYQYKLASKNAFLPLADDLSMDMQGRDNDTYNSIPVWWFNWSYAKHTE